MTISLTHAAKRRWELFARQELYEKYDFSEPFIVETTNFGRMNFTSVPITMLSEKTRSKCQTNLFFLFVNKGGEVEYM